jgi:hypothetical protein
MFVPGGSGSGQYLLSSSHVNNPPLSPAFTAALKKDAIGMVVSDQVDGLADKLNFAPRGLSGDPKRGVP